MAKESSRLLRETQNKIQAALQGKLKRANAEPSNISTKTEPPPTKKVDDFETQTPVQEELRSQAVGATPTTPAATTVCC